MPGTEAVILVGHGAIASDTPLELVTEFKRLCRARRRRNDPQPSERELELDRIVREWPRTEESDRYKAGLESIAAKLRPRLGRRQLVVAYNEFCAPSLRDAIAALAAEGATKVIVVTTMFTPGGSHSELDLPGEIEQIRRDYPAMELEYAWPYGLDRVADFLASHLDQDR